MRGAKAWFWFSLGAILLACSPDPDRVNYAYLRSPSFFRADTTFSDHPLCKDSQVFTTPEECSKVKKYQLTWVRPEDTARLVGYRIYLDTTDPNLPGKHWNDLKDRPEFASIIVQSKLLKDTLFFIFGQAGFRQDTLKPGSRKIFVLDSSKREEETTGNLDFALVPVYSGDATPGQPQFAYFQTRDKQPPDGFHPAFIPRATQVEIAWERPTDRVSFFDPSQDTGMIAGYSIEVQLVGKVIPEKKNSFRPKLLSYQVGSTDMLARTSMVFDSVDKFVFSVPDSNRSAKRVTPLLSDSLHLVIGDVRPLDTLKVRLYAIDSSGNRNINAMEIVTLIATDTTQPSKPVMSRDSITQNGFRLWWLASSDSLRDGDQRLPGPKANFNIQNYRLIRTLIRDSTSRTTSLDRVDTTILIDSNGNGKLDTFKLSMKFLPPGTLFRMRLSAIDRSGFESLTDTMSVRTDSVRFAGTDSALECPKDFIPVPRGNFRLGDNASSSPDEKPAANVMMGPYCIEPYEHRDSTGRRFVSNVTYRQAEEICRSVDTAFATNLCSEVEWERACEGPESTNLTHGIQSEGTNASILQSSCNQGTNDSAMAMSFELRNSLCLTTEGVYDMAGNLSEWVRDPYVADAYSQSSRKDTVYHDFRFTDPTATDSTAGKSPPGIRGGNYLKTSFPQQSLTQNLARCSNRDFAAQVRPVYRAECQSESGPKIAVIYAPGLTGHRCVDVPVGVDPAKITEIRPDSARILIFLSGVLKPVPDTLPPDTVFKGRKPVSALLTTRSLAVVTFVSNKGASEVTDILDAKEMRDTSQAALERIFTREAGNAEWTVRKQNGKFEIKYLYAYSIFGTKPAKPYYSSRVIGFRCCSLARPRQVPADTTVIAGN
ncbi:MAG: SUMF1/EgtB/PvdO family nonheme iron enzyme [Fibrobacteria bacterium]